MHAIVKNGVKDIAHQLGLAATFMAKWSHRHAGSSSHIHQSLWSGGRNAFAYPPGKHGMSDLMRHYLAGQLTYAGEITAFLAPYVNSYKRFVVGMFAPTKAVWSVDNRTAGFRLIGTMFMVFAGVALVLAAAGLFGVLAFHVGQRTREIGVRRALGADDRRILRMVMRASGVQILIGVAIGVFSRVWADVREAVAYATTGRARAVR